MAMHLPGVAVGLDVVAWHPPDKSVVIYPGVAVDSDGNTIVVGESQRFQLKTQDAGTAYLTLRYREVPQEMTQAPGEEEPQPAYILDAYVLEDRRQVPGPDEIELARIDISGSDSPISDASNLQSPGQDEIDLRFRSVSGPRQLGDVAIGVLPLESGPGGVIRHLPGSASLVRAINATTSYRARFKGVVSLGEDITDCDLLVVAGKAELSLTDDWVSVLRRFLDRGGVLMGERCAGAGKGSGEPFQRSFLGLVDSLGESLSVPDRQHPRRRLRVSLGWSRPGRDWPRVHPVGSGARDQPRCILLTPRLIASSQVGGRVAATEPKWGWMSDNIRVSLATETLQVTPGESIQTEISIRKVSNVVDVFSVALTDLDSSWYELSADSSSLFPNDDVTITLTISPPKTSASVAKSYPFTVKVSSQKDATQQTSVSATLEVQAEYSFDVDLTPQKATGAKGSYTLNLVNTGNAMLTVGLEEKDPEDACRFYFNPQNPRLAPGEKAAVTTTVEPGRRPLTGAPRRITSP